MESIQYLCFNKKYSEDISWICYGEKFNIHLKSLTRVECLLTSRRLRRSSLYREVRIRALAE